MPKNLYKLLKRKYEPNKYMLFPKAKNLSKTSVEFFRHCPVTHKIIFVHVNWSTMPVERYSSRRAKRHKKTL